MDGADHSASSDVVSKAAVVSTTPTSNAFDKNSSRSQDFGQRWPRLEQRFNLRQAGIAGEGKLNGMLRC